MLFESFRYKIIKYIVRKVFKISEGEVLPKYLVFLKFCFFPITYFVCTYYNNIYDFNTNTYTINGLKFSREFFNIDKIGKKFEVIELKNGVITVKDI